MTKARIVIGVVAALALLALPLADAHGAPKPREYQARLLGDCEDDLGGADGYDGPGYDLHSLDAWEAWDDDADRVMTWFRVVLNGGDSATVTLELEQPATSYSWSTSDGQTWSADGFTEGGRRDDVWVNNDPSQGPDGERFALVGAVPRSTLGGEGAKLDGYTLESDDNGWSDNVPGLNGLAADCVAPFERADYTLQGTGRYADLELDDNGRTLLAEESNFVDVQVSNLLKLETQAATLRILDHDGDATVRFHDPGSGDDGYSDTVALELGKRGGAGSVKVIHLDIQGAGGSSGTVDVELITDLGGRVVASYDYDIAEDAPQVPETPEEPETPDSKGSPGPALPLALVLLGAFAIRRR